MATHSRFTKARCFEILGLQPSTPLDGIKAAYKTLAKKNHPDKAGLAKKQAIEMTSVFVDIKEAYEVLTGEVMPATQAPEGPSASTGGPTKAWQQWEEASKSKQDGDAKWSFAAVKKRLLLAYGNLCQSLVDEKRKMERLSVRRLEVWREIRRLVWGYLPRCRQGFSTSTLTSSWISGRPSTRSETIFVMA